VHHVTQHHQQEVAVRIIPCRICQLLANMEEGRIVHRTTLIAL
jgi:hypothetical protein